VPNVTGLKPVVQVVRQIGTNMLEPQLRHSTLAVSVMRAIVA
jgi:hypothetical protein